MRGWRFVEVHITEGCIAQGVGGSSRGISLRGELLRGEIYGWTKFTEG